MSNNELGTNLKGASGDQPWLNLHADDAIGLEAQLRDYLGAFAPQEAVGVGVLIGLANEKYRRELAQASSIITPPGLPPQQNVQAAAPLAPPPVSVQQPQPAAPAQPAGWQAPEVPQYQAPPAAAPSAPTAPPGDLPPGVLVWQAPNPEAGKEQYTELWFEYPFIKSPDDRGVLKAALNAAGVKPWFHSPTKKWITKTGNEAAVRSVLTQNAHLFA